MARRLGAKILVIHGDRSFEKSGLNDREYYDRFGILSRIAREYGVTLAQENVNAFPQPGLRLYTEYAGIFKRRRKLCAGCEAGRPLGKGSL